MPGCQQFLPSIPTLSRRQFRSKTFKSRWPKRRGACVGVSPFWSHPDVLEFTLKGYSVRGRVRQSPLDEDELVSVEQTKRRDEQRERPTKEKVRRVTESEKSGTRKEGESRNSGAQALYDDGGFARKSQCSATPTARIRCCPCTSRPPLLRDRSLDPSSPGPFRVADISKNRFIIRRW